MSAFAADPLTTLEYHVVGSQLRVTPAMLAVPKGVPGSVLVEFTGPRSQVAPAGGADSVFVEALLRGPSFPARRVVGKVNEALLLPPLNLVGDYELNEIRLVDAATGEVRLEATPNRVPIRVFDEVLVSRVTSRPLTLDEIQEKGIVIDERNFRAVEFEVGFVVDGETVPVKFPVVAPAFGQETEIIPDAELNERLQEAERINQELALGAELPRQLEASGLNIEVKGINFQFVDEADGVDLALQVPPIPALMVIPGNIGYLNQFFSVQIFTENAAPAGSGLSVRQVIAALKLPNGPDTLPGTYDMPGDDPLRFARVGPDAVIENTQLIVQPGADGRIGTGDDVDRLRPGETGQAEFLVEGLREGLHVMDVELTASLEGLAAGPVKIMGKAAGSVLVRNPNFSLAFSHPRTIRAGEPYTATVTILNTSLVPANLVSVTLPPTSISGAVLMGEPTMSLGNIAPGGIATAVFQLRAQKTGAITFSQLTTDDDIVGRFRLRAGVDERGVALSPATIGFPDFVDDIPADLFNAANRVLGQALSVSTAGQMPPGVARISKSIVTTRVLELAEAGQRIRYGDAPGRVWIDLLFDWQGGRSFREGWDQLMRETDAGREFREALMAAIGNTGTAALTDRLAAAAPDLAGRGESWWVAAGGAEGILTPTVTAADQVTTVTRSEIARTLGYGGADEPWMAGRKVDGLAVQWHAEVGIGMTRLVMLDLHGDGAGRLFTWTVTDLPAGGCLTAVPGEPDLAVDADCDGTAERTVAAVETAIAELPPMALAAIQDVTVKSGRPPRPCEGAYENYGTVVAVLFSKPMTQSSASDPAGYVMDNGVGAQSVQIQPGGRVALVSLRAGVGTIRERTLTIRDVSDPRGNVIPESNVRIATTADQGVAIRGRVVRADGSPAVNVPVTLTMYDENDNGLFGCEPFIVRVSQVRTDASGYFDFDFVMGGIPYSVSATDTTGLSEDAIRLLVETASGDQFNREKLLALANSPSSQNTLLQAFAVGALPQAVAMAEGLDRALLRDFIPDNSPRQGTEITVALRFRGRGTVSGRVLAPDGLTPLSRVAVNLFPAPDSREQGRGLFTDDGGRFTFFGVPLGNWSVEATASSGLRRTVSGVIAEVGGLSEIEIVLSEAVVERTRLAGRVLEANGVDSHPSARVYVGKFISGKFQNVVAAVTADAGGYWVAREIPVDDWDLVALSVDGKRKGERHDVAAATGGGSHANLILQGRANVTGRVEFANGTVAANALVAGGEALVRTDANGVFMLTGVPTGRSTISAGVERDAENGIDFPRLGSASLDVVGGVENFVVIRLESRGRIIGRVLDVEGNAVPNMRVALPQTGGFLYVDADDEGRYAFEGLALKDYTVSAPAPLTAQTDVSGVLDTLGDPEATQDEILAAIGEAFEVFTGVNDPLLTGEGRMFNPITWGFARTRLTFDGQTAVADIRFLREGTISGTVLNGQGVPIGARVRLTGIGPTTTGDVGFIIRGERNSDPALGTFDFPGQALAGPWGLQAASPFFPSVISTSGATRSDAPNQSGVILQFPATREINGRLTGTILNPNGEPVGPDVLVKISFADLQILTRDDGTFDTQIDLPALDDRGNRLGYSIEAEDPASGLRGRGHVTLTAGQTTDATVTLLDKGALSILVARADGEPAAGADVLVNQGTFPMEVFEGTTDAEGRLDLSNLFEGSYSIRARLVSGLTTLSGRSGVTVRRGQTAMSTVRLTATGSISGRFVQQDRTTPIGFAQIEVGSLGFSATDSDGRFMVDDVPLGTYRLVGRDPVSGRLATQSVTLNVEGESREVLLVERSLGEVVGAVLSSDRSGYVAGATVTLTMNDGIIPGRSVTTGPDGTFSFPGTPAGGFRLSAVNPITKLTGAAAGVMPENAVRVTLDVPLEARGSLRVTVLRPDPETVETEATVTVGDISIDTDENGQAFFANLRLTGYTVVGRSMVAGRTRSVTEQFATLTEAGVTVPVTVVLPGVGSVEGTVFASDGISPVPGAEVRLTMEGPLVHGESESAVADGSGRFTFNNVGLGPVRLTAREGALGTTASSRLDIDGQALSVDLTLGESGTVRGRLVESDGATVVPGVNVSLSFMSQSGLLGVAALATDALGVFSFSEIPVGEVTLEAIVPPLDGIARSQAVLTGNGSTLDLGDVVLDQFDPFVVSVDPPDTRDGVTIQVEVVLTFSEALDPGRIDPDGIFLRLNTEPVPTSVTLEEHPDDGIERVVRLVPDAPLQSEMTYTVVAIDGERVNATGGVIGRGPRDLVGRVLVTPFISTFSTADEDPPDLLSLTPETGAEQVDPRGVVRASFNEAIRNDGFNFTLAGPNGAVPGRIDVGVNSLVLVFTPDAPLAPNTTYTAVIDGVRDIAGNLAADLPFSTTFASLDTLGPTIAELRIKDGAAPVAGATIEIEAVLAVEEGDARVRMSRDLTVFGETDAGDFDLPLTLPLAGSLQLRAVAIDRFGNEGPLAELLVTIVENQPPQVRFRRITPPTGPVTTGEFIAVDVTATDDSAVAELRAAMSGAIEVPLSTSDGSRIRLEGIVPESAGPEPPIQILAEAVDESGKASGQQALLIEVADGTSPTLVITGPAANTAFVPGSTIELNTAVADNFGVTRLEAMASGAFDSSNNIELDPMIPEGVATVSLAVPAEAPPDGSPFTVAVRAFDAAGNESVTATIELRMDDASGPSIVSVTPGDGAGGVSRQPVIEIVLSEPIDPGTASGEAIQLRRVADTTLVATEITVSEDRLRITVSPVGPLDVDTEFELTVLATITDLSGNALDAGFTGTFRTGSFLLVREVAPLGYNYGPGNEGPNGSYPDSTGLELIDGRVSNTWQNPGFVGVQDAAGSGADSNQPQPWLEFEFATEVILNFVRIHYAAAAGSGIFPPDEVRISTSLDGETFSEPFVAGGFSDAQPTASLTLDMRGATARFVRMDFRNDQHWTFIDEITFFEPLDGARFFEGSVVSGEAVTTEALPIDHVQFLADNEPFQRDSLPPYRLVYPLSGQQTVFAEDFEEGIPPEMSGIDTATGTQGYADIGFGAAFLRNSSSATQVATLTLTDLPAHTHVDLRFWLAILDSWDGTTVGVGPDRFVVRVDGVEVFNEAFLYNNPNAFYGGPTLGETVNRGFAGWNDPAYDMTLDPLGRFSEIPHVSNTLTVEFFATGLQTPGDESWAIDNLEVSLRGLPAELPESISLSAEAVAADATVLATAQARVHIIFLADDEDGDGIDNGTELALGLDPFRNDLDDDLDEDGLTNGQELALGTDLSNPDTDGDGFPDGEDVNPLAANGVPAAGRMFARHALDFDGVDDYVQTMANPSPHGGPGNGQGAVSLSAWVRVDQFRTTETNGTTFQPIVLKGDSNQWEYGLNIIDDRQVSFALWNCNGSSTSTVFGGELTAGQWHHVAGTFDKGAGVQRLYIDGLLIVERTGLNGGPCNGTALISIGSPRDFRAIDGAIDEVRVWRTVRTREQIRQDMRRRLTGREPDLIGYWSMDEGSGDAAYDHSFNTGDGLFGRQNPATHPAWREGRPLAEDWTECVDLDGEITLILVGEDPDGDALDYQITRLPEHGTLHQVEEDGTVGAVIEIVPALVSHPSHQVAYLPSPGYAGPDRLRYNVTDGVEASAPAEIRLHVMPETAIPVAIDDSRATFQDTPIDLADLLANDSDPDGDAIRMVANSSPTNGTLTDHGDGTLTYTPDPGFNGVDSFTYTIADRMAWVRREDFTPGIAVQRLAGNPDGDGFGFPVWTYEYVRGGPIDSEAPWYSDHGALMIWDNSWFGGGGVWVRRNDVNPPIGPVTMTHTINSQDSWEHVPLVRWISPFDTFAVDIVGELVVTWTGANGIGSDIPIDVVLAVRTARDGAMETLLTETLQKPTAGDSVGDRVRVPIRFADVTVDKGDQVIISFRSHAKSDENRWPNLQDRLAIVPSGSTHTATVTLNVGANETPVALGPTPGYALELDGSGDFVDFGNPPELQITGNQTIEFWMNPANIGRRENPFGKAYGGEGTMTLEENGKINYFYGVTGANSGAAETGYDWLGSRFAFPVGRWSHVAFVRDLENGRLSFYINGRLTNERDARFEAAVAGANAFTIGAGYVSNFTGRIDEFRAWNIERTPEQILQNAYGRLDGDEEGLVAYWNFDEGAGDTVGDATANALSGTLRGNPVWVPSFAPFDEAPVADEDTDLILTLNGEDADGDVLRARIVSGPTFGDLWQTDDGTARSVPLFDGGGALRFDGSDDHVALPSDVLDGRGDMTIEFWVKTSVTRSQTILSGANAAEFNELILWFHTDSTVRFYLKNEWVDWPEGDLRDGRWHHLAFLVDGTNDAVDLMIDGVALGRRTLAIEPIEIDSGGLFLGEEQDSLGGGFAASDSFDGELDEFRIWHRVLGAEEVRANSNIRLSGGEDGLAGYWSFDESEGVVAGDLTGNQFDGTLGGSNPGLRPLWVESGAAVGETGWFVSHPDRRIIVAPDPDFNGIDFLSFLVDDGKVSSTVITVPIRFDAVNDAPRPGDDVYLTIEDVPVRTGNVFANDLDVESDAFSLSDFTQPDLGGVEWNDDGTFTYTPSSGFTGEETFTYTLSDGQAESEPATVTITVTPVDTFRWVNAAGGSFNDPMNWDREAVPGPGDKAAIDLDGDYTVTIDADARVARLIFGGSTGVQTLRMPGRTLSLDNLSEIGVNAVFDHQAGTVRGIGTLMVNGHYQWNGGTMTDAGSVVVGPDATMTLAGADQKTLSDGRMWVNAGTVIWEQGNLVNGGGHVRVEVLDSGLFDIRTDAAFSAGHWEQVTFVNEGRIRKSAGEGTTTLLGSGSGSPKVLHNRGSVEVNVGRLRLLGFGTGTGIGRVEVAEGAVMEYAGGGHVFEEGSEIGGDGLFQVNGATVTLRGQYTVPTIEVQSGTFNVADDLTVDHLALVAGQIGGNGKVTASAAFTWAGGTMTDAGETTMGPEATGTLSGSGQKNLANGRVWSNAGTVIWEQGRIWVSGGAGRFNNLEGGVFEIKTDEHFSTGHWEELVVVNEGGIRKTAGEGTTTLLTNSGGGGKVLHNRGTIGVDVGRVQLQGRGTGTGVGRIEIGEGATLEYAGGVHVFEDGSEIVSQGLLAVTGGTVRLDGNYTAPAVSVSGGALNATGALAVDALSLGGGQIGGVGKVTVLDALNWTGGTMNEAGETMVGSDATGTLSGSGQKNLANGRVWSNAGTVIWEQGRIWVSGGTGRFNNLEGGVFEIKTDEHFSTGHWEELVVVNEGILRKTAGEGTTTFLSNSGGGGKVLHNRGTIGVDVGRVRLQGRGTGTGVGRIEIGEGATLEYLGGVHVFEEESEIISQGLFTVTGGTVQLDGNYTAPSMSVSGGALNATGELAVDALSLGGGQIGGVGKITVLDALNWTGGTMNETGETMVGPEAIGTLSGSAQKQLANGRVWSNAGTVIWEQGEIRVTAGVGRFNNLEGGVFEIKTDEGFSAGHWATLTIDNGGTIRKTAGEGRTTFGGTSGGGDKVMHHSGVIDVAVGEVYIANRSQGNFSGSLVVGVNGRLILASNSFLFREGHSFVGAGTLRFQSPVTFQAPAEFGALNVFIESNASFAGAFPVSVGAAGSITFLKSIGLPHDLTVAGTMNVPNDNQPVTIARTLTLASTGILNNSGVVRAGAFVNDGGTINGNEPEVTGLPQQDSVRIDRITVGDGTVAKLEQNPGPPSAKTVIIHWSGPSDIDYVLEASDDLKVWKPRDTSIVEAAPGAYRGSALIGPGVRTFFRIRTTDSMAPPASGE